MSVVLSTSICSAWNTQWHVNELPLLPSNNIDSSSLLYRPLLTTSIEPFSSTAHSWYQSTVLPSNYSAITQTADVLKGIDRCKQDASDLLSSNGSKKIMLEGPVLECVRTDIALTLLSNVTFSDITMNYLEDPLRPTETDPGCGTTSLRLKKTHLVYSFEMFSWKELPGNYLCSRAGVFGFNEHGLMNISEAFEYLENNTLYAACLLVEGKYESFSTVSTISSLIVLMYLK